MTEIELNGPRLHHILVARDAQLDKPLKSVTHGRQTYTATDAFSDAGHHRFPWPVPNYTAWYRRCKQLAQGCYAKAERPRIKPTTLLSRESNSLTITALGKGGGQRVNTGAAKLYLTSCHRCAHNSSHTCRSKLAVHRSCGKRQYERRERTYSTDRAEGTI